MHVDIGISRTCSPVSLSIQTRPDRPSIVKRTRTHTQKNKAQLWPFRNGSKLLKKN